MTEPTGLNVKVAIVIEDLATIDARITGLEEQVRDVRGADLTTLDDLKADLASMAEAQSVFYDNAIEALTGLIDAVGLLPVGDSDTVRSLLQELRSGIGINPGDATSSVIGHLSAIERLSRCNCPPEPPDLTDPDAPCADPYTSVPLYTRSTDLYPGRVFAGFLEPPPTGLTMDSFLSTPVDKVELHRTSDSAGYWIYVQSSAPLASLNPLNPLLVKTNEWLDLTLYEADIAVSVPDTADLTVYICTPGDLAWVDCIELTSAFSTYSTNAPFTMDVQAINFESVPTLEATDNWTQGGTTNTLSLDSSVVTSDMFGVKVELVSGANVRVLWRRTDGIEDHTDIASAGLDYTIIAHTNVFTIGNYPASDPSAHPFTINLCPPEGD